MSDISSEKFDAHAKPLDVLTARQILDVLAVPVVITDTDFVITEANAAAIAMFKKAEPVLVNKLPGFSAKNMIGTCIDDFHSEPARQRGMLEGLDKLMRASIRLPGFAWDLAVTPLKDETGKTIRLIAEFEDRSEVQHAENQFEKFMARITEMADAHEAGDIDVFMECDDLENGVVCEAGEKVNEMVKGHIDTKKEVVAVYESFAEGDYSADLAPLPGQRAFLNRAVNRSRETFTEVTNEIKRLSNAIMEGNLDVQADTRKFKGAYREVVESFDAAFKSLNGSFHALKAQVDQVAQTVGQMSNASQELATNSQIASSSVDEVSASTEETDVQVKANAEAAKNAAHLVNINAEVAAEGKGKINEMVEAMEGIDASSQDIAKIIKVIDEIAFQTNLLALNAAVEAARAGQHGRGFAVVAQEVRNLAGRSAKAARETSDLIEGANSRVTAGVRLASETSESFEKIADNIAEVKDLVETINRASEEQSRGVAQINVAIGEVARTALSTSQQADELAATSAEMTAATEHMAKEIARFRLGENGASADQWGGMSGMENLPPEMMAKLQEMMDAGHVVPPAAAAALNGNGHANGHAKSHGDYDERGFSNF
ncbi:MAG: methyl-accepting chemotaxis protein [Thalassovita sp.]|nr:methyl-accepting chemotaxis protein [Thalassovita sp.]